MLHCPVKTHCVVMLHHTPVQGFAAEHLLISVDCGTDTSNGRPKIVQVCCTYW